MSSFAWLDFSEHERRRALEVIERFSEHETVDELGIGTIRDAFAELFFPGTSVIHTRARYFFFIPWLYLKLEGKKVPSEKIAGDARRAELALIEVLLASDDNDGTIGRRARSKLKILPSAIYWPALARLEFCLFPGSRDQYHRSVDRFYQRRASAVRTDDGDRTTVFRTRNWHPRLPSAPDDFPKQASMTLTRAEAEFFREQVVLRAPNCFYRHLVDGSVRPNDADFPWEYDRLDRLPAIVQEQLNHARAFSEIIHGAPLLHNLMLAELCGDADLASEYRGDLASWRTACDERASEFARWDRRRFWELTTSGGAHVSTQTRAFTETWIKLALSPGESVADSRAARQLIHERERQLKRGQARLDNQRARELWRGSSGTGRIVYRWGIALQMVNDVFDGLGLESAHA